jgi:hypothetical protein
MSIRNTSVKSVEGFQYSTHVHQAFNRQPASEMTQKEVLAAINNIDISGGSIDVSTLAKEETLILVNERLNEQLSVNTVDVSGLALQETQGELLALAQTQGDTGVKINPDQPPLTSYDFANNHVQMTMIGPTTQDFRWNIDTEYNRDGWTFSTKNGQVLGSNCYWYANGAGTGNQAVLLYQDFTSWYIIVTIDNTGDVEAAPFINAYSPPTGTNDAIPTFAHSRWTFALPGDAMLFQNEQVLLYYGADPDAHSNLRRLPLNLVSPSGNNGDRLPTEMIYLISTNTASGLPVAAVNYVNQGAGFVAQGINREYYFSNSLERKQLANLSATNIPVSVSGTVAVSGTFFQATQPVSIAETVDVSGAFYQATQPVSIAETVAVSGTFYQATQPVSIAETVAVSGTFYQATQPVSIAETVDVSGAFYQATQPVSIAETVDVSGSVSVSNFPSVQDISGSVSVLNFPTVQDISNANIDSLSFTTDKGVKYLNTSSTFGLPIENNTLKVSLFLSGGSAIAFDNPLAVKIMATPTTTFAWTLLDFTPNNGSVGSVSPPINSELYNSLLAFGTSTHSGGGGNPSLTYQYSLDDITYYDSSFVITLPNNAAFSNSNSLGAPWVRFKVSAHTLDSLTLNVAAK